MNKFKDPAITILILTVVSYGVAYLYLTAYNSYYQLPFLFVELNITTVVLPLLVIFCFLCLICYGIYLIWMYSLDVSVFKSLNIYLLIGFIIVMGLWGVIKVGDFMASLKREYMVIHQDKDLFVVVTTYQDSLIIAPLDLEKESMTPNFKAIETKDLKDAETIHFENGLKVEDVRNSKDLID